MATIVLAPGAWLGKWAWERVTPELEGAGHTVYPVTLPGLADRLGELSPKVGLMSHVNDLVGFCDRIDMKRGIILGHSYAGAVVGGVARRIPSRLKAQVYIDTLPIDEGKALLGVFSPTGRSKFEDSGRDMGWDPRVADARASGRSGARRGSHRRRPTAAPKARDAATCFHLRGIALRALRGRTISQEPCNILRRE